MCPLGRRGQVVRQRFAKPSFVGSNPTVASSAAPRGNKAKKEHNSVTQVIDDELSRAEERSFAEPPLSPLPNYSLSSVCPACESEIYRHACKVRCPTCGFMWDCSEL